MIAYECSDPIKLDPETQRLAQAKAAELGISFAEYIRRVVAEDLGEPKRKVHISAVFDLGQSAEPTDVAHHKHKMIAEAVWEDHQRTRPKGVRRRIGAKS